MRRDLRDPAAVGKILTNLTRVQKVPVLMAADELSAYAIRDYASNETCIQKYGRPGEHQPRFEQIQIS